MAAAKKVNASKLANDLYKLKDEIKEAQIALSKTKEAKKLAKLVEKQKDLSEKAENYLLEEEISSVDGGTGKIGINETVVPVVEDWPKFYAFIHKNKAYHMLNKKAKSESVREYWEESGKKIPGVNKFTAKKLSITKGKNS